MEIKQKNNLVDRSLVYGNENDFYDLGGSIIMKLTPQAAMSVCKSAAKRGVLIWRIEGGIKHLPSTEFPCGAFEARLDCIWDGPNPPMSMQEAAIVNRQAYDFIKEESLNHNAFIITATEVNKNYNRS